MVVDGAATMVAVTMAGGVVIMATVGTEIMTDSVAKADGMVVADSAAAEGSSMEDSTEVTGFMVGADFTGVAAVEADSMEVVAGSTAGEVEASTGAADLTGEATGNNHSILPSHMNGWQAKLPAVFFCF
jgi:hypothetical protein